MGKIFKQSRPVSRPKFTTHNLTQKAVTIIKDMYLRQPDDVINKTYFSPGILHQSVCGKTVLFNSCTDFLILHCS